MDAEEIEFPHRTQVVSDKPVRMAGNTLKELYDRSSVWGTHTETLREQYRASF